MSQLILYSYFRSTAAYRVRIALNLKGLRYTIRPINLVRGGGEHHTAEYLERNPQGLIPSLIDGDRTIQQSLAIVEYLEERFPRPPLLPTDPADRAYVRGLALMVSCDIHPLNNLRVMAFLGERFGVDEAGRMDWYHHWLRFGFDAIERQLRAEPRRGTYCLGDSPSLADVCLVAQLFNARRFGFDLAPYPILLQIDERCRSIPAFAEAAPENQPDAET